MSFKDLTFVTVTSYNKVFGRPSDVPHLSFAPPVHSPTVSPAGSLPAPPTIDPSLVNNILAHLQDRSAVYSSRVLFIYLLLL